MKLLRSSLVTGNKIMSSVNTVYDRLYFVPQLGMFHSEMSMLITIEVSVLVHYQAKV